jgi:hypothetical protein
MARTRALFKKRACSAIAYVAAQRVYSDGATKCYVPPAQPPIS